jgi:hypothetical protein
MHSIQLIRRDSKLESISLLYSVGRRDIRFAWILPVANHEIVKIVNHTRDRKNLTASETKRSLYYSDINGLKTLLDMAVRFEQQEIYSGHFFRVKTPVFSRGLIIYL